MVVSFALNRMEFSLVLPAFIAGVLTFLAPCTLPLVPAYLGFIGGISPRDLADPPKLIQARRTVFLNGVFYALGFSSVFIFLGVLFGLGGSALVHYRLWLSRIGGVFVMFFGLYMMGVFKTRSLMFLQGEHRWSFARHLKPGRPSSSFLLGATFAFGWTPCVGPILGSVLLLASSSATIVSGALLLAVFSLGLAVPFLLIALGFGHATQTIKRLSSLLPMISFIGGGFLLFLGVLLVSDKSAIWFSAVYGWFQFIDYQSILKFL